jgi:hypothetical protein
MNLAQIADILPNGFHDAKLIQFELDKGGSTAILQMRILVSDIVRESAGEPIRYKPAELSIMGLSTVDVPTEFSREQWSSLDVEGFIPNEKQWLRFATLDETARQNAYSFFIRDWNTFIHTVASNAEINWFPS